MKQAYSMSRNCCNFISAAGWQPKPASMKLVLRPMRLVQRLFTYLLQNKVRAVKSE
jgi:hypothetical protein